MQTRQTQNSFSGPKSYRTFEKQDPGFLAVHDEINLSCHILTLIFFCRFRRLMNPFMVLAYL